MKKTKTQEASSSVVKSFTEITLARNTVPGFFSRLDMWWEFVPYFWAQCSQTFSPKLTWLVFWSQGLQLVVYV